LIAAELAAEPPLDDAATLFADEEAAPSSEATPSPENEPPADPV